MSAPLIDEPLKSHMILSVWITVLVIIAYFVMSPFQECMQLFDSFAMCEDFKW